MIYLYQAKPYYENLGEDGRGTTYSSPRINLNLCWCDRLQKSLILWVIVEQYKDMKRFIYSVHLLRKKLRKSSQKGPLGTFGV